MLAHDRRHAFGTWVFAAAAAYFLLHLYNILYMLNEPENPAILVWRFSGSMGLVPDAMPLLAALPAAAAFAVDLNSGFAVPAVLRAGTKRYLRSKLLAACIGGGLAPLLGRLLFVIFLHILYRGDVSMGRGDVRDRRRHGHRLHRHGRLCRLLCCRAVCAVYRRRILGDGGAGLLRLRAQCAVDGVPAAHPPPPLPRIGCLDGPCPLG